jgi:hypothetical protein
LDYFSTAAPRPAAKRYRWTEKHGRVRGCWRLIKWNQFLIDPFLLCSLFFFVFYQRRVAGFRGCPLLGLWLREGGSACDFCCEGIIAPRAFLASRCLLFSVCVVREQGCWLCLPPACESWSARAATINKKLSATHLLLRFAKSIRRKDCFYLSPTPFATHRYEAKCAWWKV